jgi:nucleoside-diphosphate-sugar epimerase
MKCLVTGGAGFIGSHLVDRLLDEGNSVTILDNLFTGKKENVDVGASFVLGDILDPQLDYLYEDIDTVFHLAALTRPQVSILEPESFNKVNVEGTLKVVRNCVEYNSKLVFVSSSSLYGEQEQYPTPEDAVPHPMSPYALTKLIGEQYCKLYEVLDGLKANYIRPFNVFGLRQNPAGGYAAAVPAFIEALSQNKPGNITGDGEQRRDFTYVDDVVDLIIKAGESEVYGEAFNAGAGNNHSINELYNVISKVMGKDIPPKHIEPVVEPHTTLADTSKGLRLLGWTPKVSLEEGIGRML